MAIAPLSTITVTAQTTLDDLKTFQESIGKDDAKLRGTVNKDGSITIKAVDKDSAFFSRLFGVSKKRRDAVRTALNQVMTQTGAVDRKPTGSLTSLINADRGHSPRSAALRDLVQFAKSANSDPSQAADRTHIEGTTHEKELLKREFPTLESKNLSTDSIAMYTQLAADRADLGTLDDTTLQQVANEIRTDIMGQLAANGPLTRNDRAMLGVSDLRGYVTNTLAASVPSPMTQSVAAALDKIADKVVAQLTEELLGTQHVDADTFKLGDETFKKVEVLGEGAFGKATLYRSETSGRELVLKAPPELAEGQDQIPEEAALKVFAFKAEIDMHTKIMDNDRRPLRELGYPHVLQFEGAIMLPGGEIGTLTEACTSGKMSDVIEKLDKAVADGDLTPDQGMAAKLTLMRDMADGQMKINDWGFSHRDAKFQNVFVDDKGVAKVADFGETAFSTSYALWTEKLVDNVLWLAPENIAARKLITKLPDDIKDHKITHLKAKIEVYNGLVGKGGMLQHLGLKTADGEVKAVTINKHMGLIEKQIAKNPEYADLFRMVMNDTTGALALQLQNAVDSGIAAMPANTLIDGKAADVWSFGTAVLEVFIKPGQSINDTGPNWTKTQKMVDYFNQKPVDPGNGLPPTPLPEALVPGSFLNADYVSPHPNGSVTGDVEVDALINKALKRDPKDRSSFADILADPVFKRVGVGEKATRDVIAAISGNPPKSSDEIKALATHMSV